MKCGSNALLLKWLLQFLPPNLRARTSDTNSNRMLYVVVYEYQCSIFYKINTGEYYDLVLSTAIHLLDELCSQYPHTVRFVGVVKIRLVSSTFSIENAKSGQIHFQDLKKNGLTLRNQVVLELARNLETHLVFTILQNACGSVPRQNMIKILKSTTINRIYIEAIKCL